MVRKSVNLMQKINPASITYLIRYVQPVLKSERAIAEKENLPAKLTLIYPASNGHAPGTDGSVLPQGTQLYVGSSPVHSTQWNYCPDKRILQFEVNGVSGHFELNRNEPEGHGLLVCNGHSFAASIVVQPLTYELDVAKDAGYVSTEGGGLQLVYDENSKRWADNWKTQKQEKALKLTYQLDSAGVVGQQVMTLAMQFTSADGAIWMPEAGNYTASIDGDFNINFELGLAQSPDPGCNLYPYTLKGTLDPWGQTLTGAILTEEKSAGGTVYGIYGRYVDESTVCGTYRVNGRAEPFSVLGGKLHIFQKEIADSHLDGTTLRWDFSGSRNCEDFEKVLPAVGELRFSQDASTIVDGALPKHLLAAGKENMGVRISADEAACRQPQRLISADDDHPGCMDLLAMTPYKKDSQGQIVDPIQNKSMDDFMVLLRHYIPEELYKQFINANMNDLSPELKGIFQMKGADGSSAQSVYKPFTTSYLTGLLSTARDSFSATLNRVRADKYLRRQLPLNELFRRQASLLYKQEFMKEYPGIAAFLDDQEKHKEKYAESIQSDCAEWKESVRSSFMPKDAMNEEYKKALDAYLAHIDTIAREAADNGKYWAYFLLRYSMTLSFLGSLQSASLSGIDSTSKITLKVQQIAALLTMLDDKTESVFVKEYMQMIQIFQLSNILPILLDLSGDDSLADYAYAVEKIARKFADDYINSSDQVLAQYAEYIQSLSSENFTKLYNCMSYAYNSLNGLFEYSKFIGQFDKRYVEVFGKIPEFAAYLCIPATFAVGIVMFVRGQISWKDVSRTDKLKLIATGAGVFATMVVKIGQRAMLVDMLKPTHKLAERIKLFFHFPESEKVVALTDSYLINSRFKQWFIGDAGLKESSLQNVADAARILGHREAEDESVLARLLGRNLDTNLIKGLGLIFAIVSIVTSSIDLHKGGDRMTQAANGLFLAGSCVDLIAIGSGMANFTLTSAILGVTGVALAIAGFIVMVIELLKKASPIEAFAKDQANAMGFYMPDGYAIDTFEIIPASGNMPSRSGLDLYMGDPDHSVTFHSDGSVSLGKFDGMPSHCLGLDVDEFGNARLYTFQEGQDGGTVPLYLTHCADGSIKALPLVSDDTDASQLWKFKATGTSQKVEGRLVRAEFQIQAGEKLYLIPNGDETGLTLSSSPKIWSVQIREAKAAGLSMPGVTLHSYDHNRTFPSSLAVEGSSPKRYAVTPQLPSFLEFDAERGIIAQKKGVSPEEYSKRTFTLSLTDALNHELPPVEFTLEVVK